MIILLISTSACGTNISAVVGDLFPTHLRAMAISLIIMFSRFGGVIGSNITAAMIYSMCTELYIFNFLLLFGSTCVVYVVLRKCELVKTNKLGIWEEFP